ncbi:hypothetical protein HMPREF1988_01409 [Porphyromonas gingivalis F0185]|nr:hypothetical protein HMPREF1988_01409 [Porphyromonas gingivalis F0185]ERJ87437.1 hypothetical protein HMPREF1989_00683 [Porphyromonas gingivalis F0566]
MRPKSLLLFILVLVIIIGDFRMRFFDRSLAFAKKAKSLGRRKICLRIIFPPAKVEKKPPSRRNDVRREKILHWPMKLFTNHKYDFLET